MRSPFYTRDIQIFFEFVCLLETIKVFPVYHSAGPTVSKGHIQLLTAPFRAVGCTFFY
jgi:hypothetical protein